MIIENCQSAHIADLDDKTDHFFDLEKEQIISILKKDKKEFKSMLEKKNQIIDMMRVKLNRYEFAVKEAVLFLAKPMENYDVWLKGKEASPTKSESFEDKEEYDEAPKPRAASAMPVPQTPQKQRTRDISTPSPGLMASKQQKQLACLASCDEIGIIPSAITFHQDDIQIMECVRLALNYLKNAQIFVKSLPASEKVTAFDLKEIGQIPILEKTTQTDAVDSFLFNTTQSHEIKRASTVESLIGERSRRQSKSMWSKPLVSIPDEEGDIAAVTHEAYDAKDIPVAKCSRCRTFMLQLDHHKDEYEAIVRERDCLEHFLEEEKSARDRLQQSKDILDSELEELTTQLFDQANNMVIEEARLRDGLEVSNKDLKGEMEDMAAKIEAREEELIALRKHISAIERNRTMSKTTDIGSPMGSMTNIGIKIKNVHVDGILFREFQDFVQKINTTQFTSLSMYSTIPFIKRCTVEDVEPCLFYSYAYPGSALKQQVLSAAMKKKILDGVMGIQCDFIRQEGTEKKIKKRCTICNTVRDCVYKYSVSKLGIETWSECCKFCRTRLSVCQDFYKFVGFLKSSKQKTTILGLYRQISMYRGAIVLAKQGSSSLFDLESVHASFIGTDWEKHVVYIFGSVRYLLQKAFLWSMSSPCPGHLTNVIESHIREFHKKLKEEFTIIRFDSGYTIQKHPLAIDVLILQILSALTDKIVSDWEETKNLKSQTNSFFGYKWNKLEEESLIFIRSEITRMFGEISWISLKYNDINIPSFAESFSHSIDICTFFPKLVKLQINGEVSNYIHSSQLLVLENTYIIHAKEHQSAVSNFLKCIYSTRKFRISNSTQSSIDSFRSVLERTIELNLSINIFSSIPENLPGLTHLIMDYNRLTSLTTTTIFNNLISLDCRGNLLENLEGLQSYTNLESIDVRDNKLNDVYSAAVSLSLLDKISKIFVSGNPLTKARDYRLQIFKQFKLRAKLITLDNLCATSYERELIELEYNKTLSISLSKSPDPAVSSHSLPSQCSIDAAKRNRRNLINDIQKTGPIMIAKSNSMSKITHEIKASPFLPIVHQEENFAHTSLSSSLLARDVSTGNKSLRESIKKDQDWMKLFQEAYSDPQNETSLSSASNIDIIPPPSFKVSSSEKRPNFKIAEESVQLPSNSLPVYNQYLKHINGNTSDRSDIDKPTIGFKRSSTVSTENRNTGLILTGENKLREPSNRSFAKTRDLNVIDSNKSVTSSQYLRFRPVNCAGSTYARSNLNKPSKRDYGAYSWHLGRNFSYENLERQLPFITMTNSLQLYLQLNILTGENEKIVSWSPINIIKHLPMHIDTLRGKMGVVTTSNSRTPLFTSINEILCKFPREQPAFLLVTSLAAYFFVPRMIGSDNRSTGIDQSSYSDPDQHLKLLFTAVSKKILRLDIGLNQKFAGLHFEVQTPSVQSPSQFINKIISLTILPRCGNEIEDLEQLVSCLSISDLPLRICRGNWTSKIIKECVLLRKGTKKILFNDLLENNRREIITPPQSNGFWLSGFFSIGQTTTKSSAYASTIDYIQLEDFDTLTERLILQPENALKLYQLVGWIVHDTQTKSTFLQTCSLGATEEFIYLFVERHDVWPPILYPTDMFPFANDANALIQQDGRRFDEKGLLADILPAISENSILRVFKISDIIKCEKWKSWRWTSDDQIEQLNTDISPAALKIYSGCIGYCTRNTNSSTKGIFSDVKGSKNPNGWTWWLRISFSNKRLAKLDIAYSSYKEINYFLAYLKDLCGERNFVFNDSHDTGPGIEFIDGDD